MKKCKMILVGFLVLMSVNVNAMLGAGHGAGQGERTPPRGAGPLQVTPNRFAMDREGLERGARVFGRIVGPDPALDDGPSFRFLTAEEKAQSQVEMRIDGNLYTVSGTIPLNGQFLYFLDMSDRLFVWPFEREQGTVFHSSFEDQLDGVTRQGSCKMAGELKVFEDRGTGRKKIIVNNDSGHYKPGNLGAVNPDRSEDVKRALIVLGFPGVILTTTEGF